MAVGFADGSAVVYKGDVTRDRYVQLNIKNFNQKSCKKYWAELPKVKVGICDNLDIAATSVTTEVTSPPIY